MRRMKVKNEEEEDDSDASVEGVTQTTPAKGVKWSYVPYQAEATDEWKVAPGIAHQFMSLEERKYLTN